MIKRQPASNLFQEDILTRECSGERSTNLNDQWRRLACPHASTSCQQCQISTGLDNRPARGRQNAARRRNLRGTTRRDMIHQQIGNRALEVGVSTGICTKQSGSGQEERCILFNAQPG